MHSLSDRCRSQRVPCACCYIYGMYKLEEKKKRKGVKEKWAQNWFLYCDRLLISPQKNNAGFFSLSPASAARGKRKPRRRNDDIQFCRPATRLQTPRPASRALSVHSAGRRVSLTRTRAVICPAAVQARAYDHRVDYISPYTHSCGALRGAGQIIIIKKNETAGEKSKLQNWAPPYRKTRETRNGCHGAVAQLI